MPYFDDIKLVAGRHLSACRVHVRSAFPDFYTLEYIHAGRMYWRVDAGPRHVLEHPAIFWHAPGRFYEYGPADVKGWDHYYLVLRGARARRLILDGFDGLGADGFVAVTQPDAVRDMFVKLLNRAGSPAPDAVGEAVIFLERLLHMTIFAPGPERAGWHGRKIRNLIERIRGTPFVEYQVEDLAREVNVSIGHFRRLFRQYARKSFHDYLLHCRMLQAGILLARPEMSVKEASDRCGLADAAQFSKQFKKQIGLSPRQYRAAVLRVPARNSESWTARMVME